MMTEKRFFTLLAKDEYTLIQKRGELRNEYLKYSEVVDLLNSLVDENEQLKKDLEELENDYKDLLYDGGFDE